MNTKNIYISYGKIGSDETARYNITLAKPMTVGEFITEWLTTGEWGYFGIHKPGAIFGDPQCEYKQGKIIGKGLPEEYLNKPIKNVYVSGGWSNSDFEFEVEGMTREEAKKTISKMLSVTDLTVRANMTEQMIEACHMAIKALEQEPCEDMGEISDGYHTFNQLYHQRAMLFATIVNEHPDISWKSFKHSDGHYCFDEDGEMFIVGIDTPEGPYTYHYHKKYWDLFKCKELECGKEWDGHTEEDVTRLLSLQQEPVFDKIRAEIKSSIDAEDTDGYSDYRAGLWQAIKIIDKYKAGE